MTDREGDIVCEQVVVEIDDVIDRALELRLFGRAIANKGFELLAVVGLHRSEVRAGTTAKYWA
jgi:hypothetical protein